MPIWNETTIPIYYYKLQGIVLFYLSFLKHIIVLSDLKCCSQIKKKNPLRKSYLYLPQAFVLHIYDHKSYEFQQELFLEPAIPWIW